jgi:hypothetical protein
VMKVGVIQALDVPRGRLADPDDFAIRSINDHAAYCDIGQVKQYKCVPWQKCKVHVLSLYPVTCHVPVGNLHGVKDRVLLQCYVMGSGEESTTQTRRLTTPPLQYMCPSSTTCVSTVEARRR